MTADATASGAAIVIGGPNDTRPREEWTPADGLVGLDPPHRQCCAHTVDRSRRCVQRPAPGKRVCRIHGGAVGAGAPIRGGRRSREVGRWTEKYRRYLEDPDLLAPEPTLAIFDTIADNLLERASKDADVPNYRRAVLEKYRAAEKLRHSGLEDGSFDRALDELGDLIEQGWEHDQAALDALDLEERRAKRAEAARALAIKEERMVPEKVLVVLLGTFYARLMELIPGKEGRRLADECRRAVLLLGVRHGAALPLPGDDDQEP